MKKLILPVVIGLLSAACTTAPPTHRWASVEDASKAKYHEDHARCQAATNVTGAGTELDTSSAAFTAYKQCMTNNGYVLTAYNE